MLQGVCRSDFVLSDLLQDIFMGNEMIPDVIDSPPRYPLEVSYKTHRTFPGMRMTADQTRYNSRFGDNCKIIIRVGAVVIER